MRHYTLAAILSHQRVSLMDVLNCFRAFPLICFVWVCARVCIDDLKSRKGGWDVGGWRDAAIRSGPLTSLCADKAGRTHTHSKCYTRTSKNDNTPQCYLHVALSSSTPPHILLYFIISFFLVETGGIKLQHGESILKCLQEIKCTLYPPEKFCSTTRFLSSHNCRIILITDISTKTR